MIKTARCAPPYSLLFVEDADGATAIEARSIGLCSVTAECIVISCLTFSDGETSISVGPCSAVTTPNHMVVDCLLKTPSRRLVVQTVEDEVLVEMPVTEGETRLRVWTNAAVEPDVVVIGIVS